MTTRAPRSRNKHKAANLAARQTNAVASDQAAHDAATENLALPLESVADTIDATPGSPGLPGDEPVPADLPVVEAAPMAGAALSADSAAPAVESLRLPVQERGSMRIELTEDRPNLGPRLRAARESRAWSREDVAHRLHVPTTVIADIEAERFDRLGAPIYIRGYLSKYAALVGLPLVVVNRAIEGLSEPMLKASTEAPRTVATWERYRVAVIGAVITLAVAVPVLTLVANRGINAPVPQVRSLDESELSEPMAIQPAVTSADESQTMAQPPLQPPVRPEGEVIAAVGAAAAPPAVEPAPPIAEAAAAAPNNALLASMSGFSTPTADGQHVVEARFREDSWIEIFDESGRVVEQALVRAGQSRRYESTGALSIKIGNVGGVDLQADGNSIDLAAHARANVARLRLFEAATTPTP